MKIRLTFKDTLSLHFGYEIHFTMNVTRQLIYILLVFDSILQTIKAKAKNVNMCERNILIRRKINLFHDINNLDLQLEEVTCRCDLYTPPYRGCLKLESLNLDTLSLMKPCNIPKNETFNIDNSSCPFQYKINEVIEECPHNITVLILPNQFVQEPVKEWLNISASDHSGVYVNCKWTGALTTVTYDYITDERTTSQYISFETTESAEDKNKTDCRNCSWPSGGYARHILLSEVADQVEIILATASGFVLAFLLVAFACLFRSSCRREGKMVVTPQQPEVIVNPSASIPEVQVTTDVSDNVFVEVHAETRRDGSGSYNELEESDNYEDTDMKKDNVNRNSNGCYDNVLFEY